MLIFLDIDGVMVIAKNWKLPELLEDGFPKFSMKAVNTLQNLIFDDTVIILTTSHKSKFTIYEWKDIFKNRGIEIQNLICLDDNINHLTRKDEILKYFESNIINDDFIIIDDDKSLNDLPTELKKRMILTSPLIGLVSEHLIEIKNILKV